jgi:hypothetical protein
MRVKPFIVGPFLSGFVLLPFAPLLSGAAFVSRKLLRNSRRAAAVAALIVPLLILLAAAANAQSSGRGGANVRAIKGGYCQVGTCNIHGGRWANNLANCKASYCR